MGEIKFSEDIRPLSELKSRPGDVVEQVGRTGRPVVLTRYGKSVAVLLSVAAYEELELARGRSRILASLMLAHQAESSGDLIDDAQLDEVLDRARRPTA